MKIQTEKQYNTSVNELEKLILDGKANSNEAIRLDFITETWEDRQNHLSTFDLSYTSLELVQLILRDNHVTQIQLSERIDISEIELSNFLSGKKPFSQKFIQNFEKLFKVNITDVKF